VEADVEAHVPSESESAANKTAPPPAVADGDSGEPAEDLPVYGWLQRVEPGDPAGGDWPRELVRAKEALSEKDRRT
jgi:hypothetical protein